MKHVIYIHATLEQARVPFAEDDLPTVALKASAEGNTKNEQVVEIIPTQPTKKEDNSLKICFIRFLSSHVKLKNTS